MVPSVVLALRLARAIGVTVETIFSLDVETPATHPASTPSTNQGVMP
jgi:DNA-binding XRE family transcriptional regulator